jgi:ADP-dependent NAD(P)H-hydrate dehydratase
MASPNHDSIKMTQISELFEPRDPQSNKGTFGSVGILGGATGMTGAVVLAGRMALKAGAGRVYVGLAQITPSMSLDTHQPELMWRSADSLLDLAPQITGWAVGCGLGNAPKAFDWLRTLFQKRGTAPLVIDADALNALANGDVSPTWGTAPVVITPHPAEAARLLQTSVKVIQHDRRLAAHTLAERFNAWVVLKGHQTLVASPQGQCQVNTTGNVALASAGTGDVLSGLIASLLAQGFEPAIAVPAGVWLHGAAADVLARRLGGPIGVTASELIDEIRLLRNQPPS